jgi:glycosyltransferase involved in cell wall biosynthesis
MLLDLNDLVMPGHIGEPAISEALNDKAVHINAANTLTIKRIKLFVDAHTLDTDYQGTQTFLRELYTDLLTGYPDLDIYFGVSKPDKIKKIFPFLKPSNILLYNSWRPDICRYLFDIPAYIEQYKFDFAHFQYMSPLLKPGCRYIVTLHDITFNDFPEYFSLLYSKSRDLLFGKSIKDAHIKTTVSDYSQDRISSFYNISLKNIHVIPNGVNPTINQIYPSKQKASEWIKEKFGIENFILYVSRIEQRKNHCMLLDKYLELELYKQGIALVFIGSESISLPALHNRIRKLSPEQKKFFYWFKRVGHDDLAAFYTSCRLFVYPSKAEGFGIPPLEAAICKPPVLCSSATAMRNFNFFKPYFFDPADGQDFGMKLQSMIDNPPSKDFLDQVAMHVKHSYPWQRSSKLFYDLISSDGEQATETI